MSAAAGVVDSVGVEAVWGQGYQQAKALARIRMVVPQFILVESIFYRICFLLRCGISPNTATATIVSSSTVEPFIRVIQLQLPSIKVYSIVCNRLYFMLMQEQLPQEPSNEQQTEGRWNQDEHVKFLQALMAHGKNWKMIENVVQTRTTAQVRSHAQKFFLKLLKIQKQRKKNLKKGVLEPSRADQYLTKALLEQTISPTTPTEILHFLHRQAPVGEAEVKDQVKVEVTNLNKVLRHGKSQILEDLLEAGEEESFLVALIRHNNGFKDPEQALNDMIAFPEIHREEKEEEQTSNKRKKSFSLYEEEQDGERYYGVLRRMRGE